MRLALRLGKTLSEILDMDTTEVQLWLGFERLEGPLGPEREDLQAAQTPATILNLFRSRGQPPVSPVDLMPDWGRTRKQREMEKTVNAWMALTARLKAEGKTTYGS